MVNFRTYLIIVMIAIWSSLLSQDQFMTPHFPMQYQDLMAWDNLMKQKEIKYYFSAFLKNGDVFHGFAKIDSTKFYATKKTVEMGHYVLLQEQKVRPRDTDSLIVKQVPPFSYNFDNLVEFKGYPKDNYWLFTIMEGKIGLYSKFPGFISNRLLHMQIENNDIEPYSKTKLIAYISSDTLVSNYYDKIKKMKLAKNVSNEQNDQPISIFEAVDEFNEHSSYHQAVRQKSIDSLENALNNLKNTLIKESSESKQIAILKELIRTEFNEWKWYEKLGDIYIKHNNIDKGIENYNIALSYCFKDFVILRLRRKILKSGAVPKY